MTRKTNLLLGFIRVTVAHSYDPIPYYPNVTTIWLYLVISVIVVIIFDVILTTIFRVACYDNIAVS